MTEEHVAVEAVECRYCKRKRNPTQVCRNTRDMDPTDGEWDDAWCHVALHQLGGGERGFQLTGEAFDK